MGLVGLTSAFAAGIVVPTPEVRAQLPIDLVCTAAAVVNLTPGIVLLTPRTINISANGLATLCISPSGAASDLTSATFTLDGSGAASCLSAAASGTGLVTWNTGEQSTLSWTISVGLATIPITSATVTSGRLAGDTILAEVLTAVPTGGICGIPGPTTGFSFTNGLVEIFR